MTTRHIFIINPANGKKRPADELRCEIDALMAPGGDACDIYETRLDDSATDIVRRAVRPDEHSRIYVCAGDGTLNEALCGLSSFAHVEVAHHPLGTGNDMVRQFGAQAAAFDSLAALVHGRSVPVDLIRLEDGHVAVNVFSVGFDARVPMEMKRFRWAARWGSKLPYDLAVVTSLFHGIGTSFEVEIDGRSYDGDYTLIIALNGQFYGGGYHPAPGACLQDGLLDIILIDKVNVFRVPALIGQYAKGRAESMPVCRVLRGRELRWKSKKPQAINYDGEGYLCSQGGISVLPRVLSLILPEGVTLPNLSSKESLYV